MAKKTYKKPEIKKIKLISEATLLAGCKTVPGGTAKSNNGCDFPGCKSLGT